MSWLRRWWAQTAPTANAKPAPAANEAAARADVTGIRYAQCWEDADVLLEALDVQPGDVCLSIASAGDNTLALLARQPERVIVVDLSPAQLACLELRMAAYRRLNHPELLELIEHNHGGSRTAGQCLDGIIKSLRRSVILSNFPSSDDGVK